MNIRFSTAALALLLMSAPVLAQTTNPWQRMIPVRPDGSVIDPGSVGGGGGTVTQGPAATDTTANRWPVLAYQGGTWSFGLSGPIPAGSNVIGGVTQSGGPWTVSGTVATSNGALDATVTARLGTLGQKSSSGSAPVVLASDQSAVSISTTRSTTYADAAFSGIAASGALYGTTRSSLAGASKFNVWAGCSVAGASVLLQGSNDAFTTTAVTIASATVAASSAAANGETTAAGTSITAPVLFSSYRGRIVNGGTANNCTIVSSFTAN